MREHRVDGKGHSWWYVPRARCPVRHDLWRSCELSLPESTGRKRFRPYAPDGPLPMPVDLRDWLPEEHLVCLACEVVDTLDLSEIYAHYGRTLRGQPPYDPRLMVKLLLYAYTVGIASSCCGGWRRWRSNGTCGVSATTSPRNNSPRRGRRSNAHGDVRRTADGAVGSWDTQTDQPPNGGGRALRHVFLPPPFGG